MGWTDQRGSEPDRDRTHRTDRTHRAGKSGHLMLPIIGITVDIAERDGKPRLECGAGYARCVVAAGGVPVMLPPVAALAAEHLRLCDGVVFTGGDDPRME